MRPTPRSNHFILEAFDRIEALSGKKMSFEYVDKNRQGDHICYMSDLAKVRRHYPGWNISKSLDDIFIDIYQAVARYDLAQCPA